MYKKTLLVNQNGDEFIGWSDNEFNPTTGELIFNTAMTGFVEILSDPSYINQIITFTSSHVGNYGMSQDDYESNDCLLYTSPSPRDQRGSRMPSSA